MSHNFIELCTVANFRPLFLIRWRRLCYLFGKKFCSLMFSDFLNVYFEYEPPFGNNTYTIMYHSNLYIFLIKRSKIVNFVINLEYYRIFLQWVSVQWSLIIHFSYWLVIGSYSCINTLTLEVFSVNLYYYFKEVKVAIISKYWFTITIIYYRIWYPQYLC